MNYVAMKLAGRCADGCERGQGVRYHALPAGTPDFTHGPALCGAKAGRRNVGFTAKEGTTINCPRCLSRMQRHDQRAEDESNYNAMIGESLHNR